jgi:integrase
MAKAMGSRLASRAEAETELANVAAGELDQAAPEGRQHVKRRAMLAVLIFAGLRISELLALRWPDIDLASGWLTVAESKTEAGTGRRIKIRGALRDELLAVRAGLPDGPIDQDALAFPTLTGKQQGPDNFRNRVLAITVKRASENLAKQGRPPLPQRQTPHSLRRTFASVLPTLGEDVGRIMDEVGHTDAKMTMSVYRQSMRRGEEEKAALNALVEGAETAVGDNRGAERVEAESLPTAV